MIFNGKYIDLELVQVSNDAYNATLQINVRRTNPYYYNREGIHLQIRELNTTTIDRNLLWYTEYNPKSTDKQANQDSDFQGEIVEANYLSKQIEYSIPATEGSKNKRYGSKSFEVKLIENEALDAKVLIEGVITLKTLEVPLPVIYDLDVQVTATQLIKKIEAVNPQNLYDLKLLSTHEGGMILDENFSHTSTIQEVWRGEKITYIARFMLNNELIAEKRKEITVPTDKLFLFVKEYNLVDGQQVGSWNEAVGISRASNGEILPGIQIWFKLNGEWSTQE